MRAIFLAAALFASPALAHDTWIHGEPIPAWVAQSCCGQADSHLLSPSQVHITPNGYRVDGIQSLIPIKKALPSQDGQYWIFFNEVGLPDPMIFCFFVPLNGV